MKIVKVTSVIVLGLALLGFSYIYAIKKGLVEFQIPGISKLANIEKDLTFGKTLNCLPTKKIQNGFTTYIVYNEGSIKVAEQIILDWLNKSMENQGGEGLTKMKSEVKLMNDVYGLIKESERLTTDGTPEQKLLMMERQIIARLHDTLAEGINMNLRAGFMDK